MRQVALLRGINVGGKNKLAMRELITLFTDEGCAHVETYIQSGNVLYDAPRALTAERLERRIRERFGLQVPVVTRTAAELARVVERNPFAGEDEKTLHVMFLKERPETARARALDPDRSPPDRFIVDGRELFLCLPNGMARTRITNAWLDRALATVATARNWRTVLELHQRCG